ncbi:hypothetical protein AB0I94_37895 [Streptomyces sp. NPDC050147]|uniref:hypothetical protein n=1 Tax=Streptomyces sp. NPDC050147 TaxID=3155513 RepID=UPI00341ABBA6
MHRTTSSSTARSSRSSRNSSGSANASRGEWLRRQIDYRFTGSFRGYRTYRLDTLNIVHGPAQPDLFLGAPTHHVDGLSSLR